TVIPAISAPNICSGASLCAGASNIFLVQASDVTIQNLTADGNNPEISSGVTSNGIDVDARNGIITDYLNFPSTVFNNLNVNHVTIKNIYLRGINNYKGTGFYFHDNYVINVAGESSSIAMFNSQGAGSFTGNHVDLANDGLASNHSKGTTYTGNTVTNSGSGIHTDNNGSGGGTADIMEGNNVSNTSWGIWVFVPYKDVQVNNNTVTNCDVGLASVGQYVSVLPSFTGNTIDGTSKSGSIGVYTSTSTWYYASGNSNHTFTNNFIKNNDYGIYIESEAGFTNTTTAKSNSVTGNTNGVEVDNSGTLNIDLTCNWWGTADGNLIAPMISGNVDYIPWLSDGTDIGDPGFVPGGSCTGAPNLTGTYKYFNSGLTPLNDVTVQLYKDGSPFGSSVSTDVSGNYTFTNVLPDTYEVRATTTKAVGGINSTDAAQVNYWVVNNSEIEKVRFYAGDVTNDNDILSLDASNIQGYFLTSGSAGFVRAPWSFWTAGETISANPGSAGYPTLVVPGSGSTVTQNFFALVTGDFNRSFTPGAKDSGSGSITLQYGQMTEVAYNETVELPIVSLQDMKVGAVSLILGFPSELMEIENVFLGEDLTNPVPFNVSGDELRVSWHTLSPVSLNAGDRLVTLMVSVTGDAGDEGILFTLAADPLNELADGSYEVIANAVLSIDILKTSALGLASNNISDMLNLSNYPNPFKGSTTFTYALPVDGRVTLEIYDMVGSKMTVLVDEVQSAGNYRINMNESMLPSGVYTAKIQLQSSGTVSSRVIKIINR
ncbi:MAG: T9SS type A sorting domain-containing protein, partial [Bacteroidales bacterium]